MIAPLSTQFPLTAPLARTWHFSCNADSFGFLTELHSDKPIRFRSDRFPI
jgi:hypothetical protein